MSLTSGYVARNGVDLSFVFQSGNSGQTSGYKLSSGQDIGAIFATYTSYLAQPTGLILNNGSDINTLFNGRSYIPLDITGCCIWLDAADITTITKDVNNRVSAWADKSTSAYSFIQSTLSNKPTYSINTQNGNATIAFLSSSSQYLVCQSPLAIGTSSFSLFAVGRYSDATTTMTMFAKSLFGVANGRFFINRDSPGTVNIAFLHPNNVRLAGTTDNYTSGAYRICELIVNRTNSEDYAFQNGSQLGNTLSVSDTTNYPDSGYYMLVGAYNNGSGTTPPQAGYYLNGNMCEIIAYKTTDGMTVANRQKIEGYLAWKWGIQTTLPSDHPFRSVPPT